MLTRACHTHFRDTEKINISSFSCIPIVVLPTLRPEWGCDGGEI